MDRIQNEQDDRLAIGKARRGDRDAFRVLVERHSRPVFRLAFRMTGSETDAEDMVQETFLKAWKQMEKFDGRASFGTWLHRICANCTLDHLRARKRRQGVPDGTRRDSETEEVQIIAKAAEASVKLGKTINDFVDLANAVGSLPGVTPPVVAALPDRIFNLLLADYLGRNRGLNEVLEFTGILER